MSTNNFYSKNTTRIYSIDCEDDFAFDDTVSNIQCSLPKRWDEIKEYEDDLRSYPGLEFASCDILQELAGYSIQIQIVAVARSGYYTGANFDYTVNYLCEGDLCDDLHWLKQDFLNTMSEQGEAGLGQMLANQNHFDKLEAKANEAIQELEAVYTLFCTPLNCKGVFSNGEVA